MTAALLIVAALAFWNTLQWKEYRKWQIEYR